MRLRIDEYRKRIADLRGDPDSELSRGKARLDPEAFLAMSLQEHHDYVDTELHLGQKRNEDDRTLDRWKVQNRSSGSSIRKRRREKQSEREKAEEQEAERLEAIRLAAEMRESEQAVGAESKARPATRPPGLERREKLRREAEGVGMHIRFPPSEVR